MAVFCRPDFLIIGAQRAGTSWVKRELSKHPQVWMPPIKELHYFDYIDPFHYHFSENRRYSQHLKYAIKSVARDPFLYENWFFYRRYFLGERSDRWYSRLFEFGNRSGKGRGGEVITGEATPAYANLSHSMWQHIKSRFPHVKLVYILRDPVARIWSNLLRKEVRNKGRRPEDLQRDEIWTELADELYFLNSAYSQTINAIDGVFDADDVLYMFYDDLVDSPAGFYNSLCEFLGISTGFSSVTDPRPANAAAQAGNGGNSGSGRLVHDSASDIPSEIAVILASKMLSEYQWLTHRFPGGHPEQWVKQYPQIQIVL